MASEVGDILLRVNANSAALDRLSARFKSFERQTTSSNQKMAASSRTTATAARALAAALTGLVSIRTAQSLLNTASAMLQVRIQIMSATTSVQQFNTVMGRLESLSLRTGSSLESTASTFQTFQLSADSLGLSVDEVGNVLETFNDIAIATGGSSFQLESALRQLGDAASAGQLRWQDFRIVLQNFPALANAIADAMGLTLTELRQAVASGQDMGEVFRAVLNDSDRWRQAAQEAPTTWERAINRVRVAYTLLIAQIDETFKIQERVVGGLDEVAERLGNVNVEQVGSDTAKAMRPLTEALDDLGATFFSSAASLLGLVAVFKLLRAAIPEKAVIGFSAAWREGMKQILMATGVIQVLTYGLQFVFMSARSGIAGLTLSLRSLAGSLVGIVVHLGSVVVGFFRMLGFLNPLGIAIVAVTAFIRAFGEEIAGITNKAELFAAAMKGINTILFLVLETIELVINALADWFRFLWDLNGILRGLLVDVYEFFTAWDAGFDKTIRAVDKLNRGLFKLSRDGIKEAIKSFKEMWGIAVPPPSVINDLPAADPSKAINLFGLRTTPISTPEKQTAKPKKSAAMEALDEWRLGIENQTRLLEHELSHQFDIRKHWSERQLELVRGLNFFGIETTAINNAMELQALEEHQANLLRRRNNHYAEVMNAHKRLADAEAKKGEERSEKEIDRLKNELDLKKQMYDQNEEAIKATQDTLLGVQLRGAEDGVAALNTVLQGAGEKAKEFFMLRKLAALAQAAIDSASAISAAYSWGVKIGGIPGGVAAATAATAASALHVAAIADTNYQSYRSGGYAEAGGLYRVGEAGAELFRSGGKQFMIPGENGQVIPNHRMGKEVGMMGGDTIININNQTPAHISTRTTETQNGKQVDILVREVERRMAQGIGTGGSPLSKAMESRYGLNRARGGYS